MGLIDLEGNVLASFVQFRRVVLQKIRQQENIMEGRANERKNGRTPKLRSPEVYERAVYCSLTITFFFKPQISASNVNALLGSPPHQKKKKSVYTKIISKYQIVQKFYLGQVRLSQRNKKYVLRRNMEFGSNLCVKKLYAIFIINLKL